MKNMDSKRKYSLRKSRKYGLSLAVIGVLYMSGAVVTVSADVVSDTDNSITVSTTTLGDSSSDVVSKEDSDVVVSPDLDLDNSSSDKSVEDSSNIDNVISMYAVDAAEDVSSNTKEVDSSKVNVSFDKDKSSIDIALPDDLVVSNGDTVSFEATNLNEDIIVKNSPTIDGVSVADVIYTPTSDGFETRRREFLEKVSNDDTWKSVTKEDIVNAYNDLLNHEKKGTYTVKLKESLNGLIGRHIYIPVDTYGGIIETSSESEDLLKGSGKQVSKEVYNSLPNVEEGVSKTPSLKYNNKDLISSKPYNYKVNVNVRRQRDFVYGGAITGEGSRNIFSSDSRDDSIFDTIYSSTSFTDFYSSPNIKLPLTESQHFKEGDITITLHSDMVGVEQDSETYRVNIIGGNIWNPDAPLPDTITFKKKLSKGASDTLEFSKDNSLSKYVISDGKGDDTLDIIYKVSTDGNSITLTNVNEFTLPSGTDSLIYKFSSKDFAVDGDDSAQAFANSKSPFVNNSDNFNDYFISYPKVLEYIDSKGSLAGTAGNYHKDAQFTSESSYSVGNHVENTKTTSAKLELKIRQEGSPNDFVPITLYYPVTYTATIKSDVSNTALGTQTGTVTVNYVDTLGNKIQEPKSLGTKSWDTEYEVKPSEEGIKGWTYLKVSEDSAPLTGSYGTQGKNVNLVYERTKSSVIANYYKEGTTEKLTESDDLGKLPVDSDYKTIAKTIDPKVETFDSPEKTVTRKTTYTLKEVPSNASGKVPLDGVEVNYYYTEKVTETVKPKLAKVVANYYKYGTTEKLAESFDYGLQEIGGFYIGNQKDIEPKVETIKTDSGTITRKTTYEFKEMSTTTSDLKEIPKDKLGIVLPEGVIINYYYVEKVEDTLVPNKSDEPKVPETPDTPDTPKPESPDTPKSDEPKVPETPDTPKPESPDTPKNEEPKVPETPDTPKSDEPKVPDTSKPEEPNKSDEPKKSEEPKVPESPDTPNNGEPKIPETPDTPKSDEPKVPDTSKNEEPKVPDTSKNEEPKVPETPKPESPDTTKPEEPNKSEEPKVPDTSKPELPDNSKPKVPETPDTPKPDEPKVPETPKPEEPKVPEKPKVSETPKPKSPDTSKSDKPKVPETPNTTKPELPDNYKPRVLKTSNNLENNVGVSKDDTTSNSNQKESNNLSRVAARHELPNTGDSTNIIALVAGLSSIALAVLTKIKSKFD